MGKLSCDAIKTKASADPMRGLGDGRALGFRFCLGLLHTSLAFLVSEACLDPRHALLIVGAEIQDANPIGQHK